MPVVQGTFEVTMNPEPPSFEGDGVTIARATFDKTFSGPLAAIGRVEFVSVRAGGVAAYVALERIAGTLEGRAGSFVVAHQARADASGQSLTVDVVSGTGRGELTGLRGALSIAIVDRVHHYTFDYSFDAAT
jgi:Protein of unknown function (DUF3224)